MGKSVQTRALIWVGVTASLAMPSAAGAGSFALREQSAIGQGEAFAGAAAGGAGLGSMFWNPATMTDFAGWQSNLNATAIFPYANLTPGAGTSPALLGLGGTAASGNIISDALLPSSYTTYQFNDRLWLGVATNSPFGSMTKQPTNFAGQIYARTSKVISYDFNPTIAYKATDWLSFGFGVEALYFKTKLSEATSPFPDAPSATLTGHDINVGFTGGLTIKPMEGTELGAGYRSSITENLSGSLSPGPALSVPAKSTINLPDQVTLGLRQAVTRDLTLSAGYEWTRWSTLGTVTVINPLTAVSLPFNYHDGSYASVGGDYKLMPNLTVRAGLGYEWSPISASIRDLRVPDTDRVSLNIGFGYRFNDKLSVDFAYSHLFAVGNTSIYIVPGNANYVAGLPFVAAVTADADLASVGVTYRW